MKTPYVPNWRHSDPQSSQDAGIAIESKASTQRAVMQRLVFQHPGYTSKELSGVAGVDRHMAGRRLPELLRAGVVRRTEDGECRWYPVSREPVQMQLFDERPHHEHPRSIE
jgi:hypothetical protein